MRPQMEASRAARSPAASQRLLAPVSVGPTSSRPPHRSLGLRAASSAGGRAVQERGSQQQQQPLRHRVASPSVLAGAAAAFSLVAAGVFAPPTLLSLPAAAAASGPAPAAAAASSSAPAGPLVALDEAARGLAAAWSAAGDDGGGEFMRNVVAEVWLSDAFISAGILGWVACSAACLARAPRRAAPRLGLAWATYFVTCGAMGRGDPPLIAALKEGFARARPSTELHHTFSFPSGHTSAAVFTVGALAALLLPMALELYAEGGGESKERGGGQRGGAGGGWASAAAVERAALPLWAAAGVTTAAGRVLADAHWLSDTLAASALSVGVVSGLSAAWLALERAQGLGNSGGGGGGSASAAAAAVDDAAQMP